jgi:hypothetical protein
MGVRVVRRGVCLAVTVLALGATGCASDEEKTTIAEPVSEVGKPPAPESPRLDLLQAQRAVSSYYSAVDNYSYATAWRYLGRGPRVENEGFVNWRAGYETMLETDLRDATPSRTGPRSASVRVVLDTVDQDGCGSEIEQTFSGTWTVELIDGLTTLTDANIDKVGGADPDVSCAPEPDPAPASSGSCHPSYEGACLDSNSYDYDCAAGSGDGPDYVDGPIAVVGDDPYGLDSDYDGTACE